MWNRAIQGTSVSTGSSLFSVNCMSFGALRRHPIHARESPLVSEKDLLLILMQFLSIMETRTIKCGHLFGKSWFFGIFQPL